MSVSPAKMYFLEAVDAWLGPVEFSGGFGSDGGVTFEAMEQEAEIKVGATGLVVAVLSSNSVAIATIKMNSHSVAYRRLFEQYDQQRKSMLEDFEIPALNFLVTDPTNGDEIGDPNAIFLSKPLPSKNKDLGDMEFKVALPNGRDQIRLGDNNQVGG